MSIASDSLENVEVIVVKLGTVIASVTRLHHVLIILTLTFIKITQIEIMKIINV